MLLIITDTLRISEVQILAFIKTAESRQFMHDFITKSTYFGGWNCGGKRQESADLQGPMKL